MLLLTPNVLGHSIHNKANESIPIFSDTYFYSSLFCAIKFTIFLLNLGKLVLKTEKNAVSAFSTAVNAICSTFAPSVVNLITLALVSVGCSCLLINFFFSNV